MKPIITRFNKNNGDIELTIPMFDKDIFHRIQQIERCNPSWFDTEHYNILDLIKENQELKKKNQIYKEVIDKLKEWEQTHTILVYTKEAPRQLVGTHELLHLLYDEDKEVE